MSILNLRRLGRERKHSVRPLSIVEKPFRAPRPAFVDPSSSAEGHLWIDPGASGTKLTLGELLDVDVLPAGVAVTRVGAAFMEHK